VEIAVRLLNRDHRRDRRRRRAVPDECQRGSRAWRRVGLAIDAGAVTESSRRVSAVVVACVLMRVRSMKARTSGHAFAAARAAIVPPTTAMLPAS